MNLSQNIEAILLFKNEPVSLKELSNTLEVSIEDIRNAVSQLHETYTNRGIVLLEDADTLSLGTHPDASVFIEKMRKDELSRELGRAGLETLAIILYKGPVSRREIDYIRGVNSGFVIRNLLIRGLISRVESETGERSFSYKPTLELLRHLGVTKLDDLPDYADAFSKLGAFAKEQEKDDTSSHV